MHKKYYFTGSLRLLNKIISFLLPYHSNNFYIAGGGNLRLGNSVRYYTDTLKK